VALEPKGKAPLSQGASDDEGEEEEEEAEENEENEEEEEEELQRGAPLTEQYQNLARPAVAESDLLTLAFEAHALTLPLLSKNDERHSPHAQGV